MFVQAGSVEVTNNSTSVSLVLPSPVGYGNAVVGCIIWDYTFSGAMSITDDKGNFYTLTTLANSGITQILGVACGGIINSPQTITLTINPSAGFVKLLICEYTPVFGLANPRDAVVIASQAVTAGTPFTVGPVSTSYGTQDVIAFCTNRGGGDLVPVSPAVSRISNLTDFTAVAADLSTTAPGNYSIQFTPSQSGTVYSVIYSLRPGFQIRSSLRVLGKGFPSSIKNTNGHRAKVLFSGKATLQFLGTTGQVYLT